MPARRRTRYQVRLRTALAGSMVAAATAASLTGLTAAPALAAPPRSISATSTTIPTSADDGVLALDASPLETAAPVLGTAAPLTEAAAPAIEASGTSSPGERLAGVRADLDRAVLLRLVTLDQANGFYAQIERRVAAGL